MSLIEVDVLYNLDDEELTEEQWKALDNLYRKLPEFMGYHDAIPYWFGTGAPTSLCASVEPPGLQVAGQLTAEQWKIWEEMFRELASKALGFEVVVISSQ